MTTLETLNFDNHFARLGPQFSSLLPPTPLPEPYLVSANPDVAALIDLDPEQLRAPEFVRFVSGNWLPPGSEPIAMLYAGHQFGQYVPQLGDGLLRGRGALARRPPAEVDEQAAADLLRDVAAVDIADRPARRIALAAIGRLLL